jgi:hypothetical protein
MRTAWLFSLLEIAEKGFELSILAQEHILRYVAIACASYIAHSGESQRAYGAEAKE